MAEMPQVLILGIVGLTRYLQRNIVRLRILDLLLAGLFSSQISATVR